MPALIRGVAQAVNEPVQRQRSHNPLEAVHADGIRRAVTRIAMELVQPIVSRVALLKAERGVVGEMPVEIVDRVRVEHDIVGVAITGTSQ